MLAPQSVRNAREAERRYSELPSRVGVAYTPSDLHRGQAMADVMCPISFEDLDALLADDQLPPDVAALFEDSARTVELSGGYEMELTEAEARALLTYATSHEMRHLERDLRQELAGFERRQRDSGSTR